MDTITPVCRLCLGVIAKGTTFYNIDQQDGLPEKLQNVQNIREIISYGVPEVDTYLSLNPSVCDKCLNNLIQIYNYKKCFLKVEDIIRKHSKTNNPISGNCVDLCNVVKQQFTLALKNRKCPADTIQAQIKEMDKVLKNSNKLVPSHSTSHLLNVMSQRFTDTERRQTPSPSRNSNSSSSSKYSFRHQTPSLLAASSSRPQPPIDLDNPQNSFLGSLNLISSETPSASNQGVGPNTGNKKLLMRQKTQPKKKTKSAALENDTVIILDDDSDSECSRNIVETSTKKSAKSDKSNEVLVMNYVEDNGDTGADLTASDEVTSANSSSSTVGDTAITDAPDRPNIAADTPTVRRSDKKSLISSMKKTVANSGSSAASGTASTSTDKLESSAIAANAVSDVEPVTNVTASADNPGTTSSDVPKTSVSVNTAPEIIDLDETPETTPEQPPDSSALDKSKPVDKNVVVKLLPLDLQDLKRKAEGEKSPVDELTAKRKKILTVNLNPSLPYLHKKKKLIVRIEKKQFLSCRVCDFVTHQGKDAIKQHGLYNHKVCMLCDYQCITTNALNKHIGNHHFEEMSLISSKMDKEEPDTINCDFCSYVAISGFDFRDHIVKKHSEGHGATDYKCPYENCSNIYNQSHTVARHVEMNHVMAKKLTCVICNHKSSSKSTLRVHVKSHMPSQITCSLCGMSYRKNSLLRMHMKNKHPQIDTERIITGMAHDIHGNLTTDDNGLITLDSFANHNPSPSEETGANRGTLVTDENGRIVLNLPRPNPLVSDPNLVVNLEERCSFEYPSLSEMLCESSFLQEHQANATVGEVSDQKTKSSKRKRKVLNKKNNKKPKVSEVEDDIDDCMIIDKEIVTVDVSDEEALLITDSEDDCAVVNEKAKEVTESESLSDSPVPGPAADSTTEEPTENGVQESTTNDDDNIIISDTESEHSDTVEDILFDNDSDTNLGKKSTTESSAPKATHRDGMEKTKENDLNAPVESPSSPNELLVSKKCTETEIGADEALTEKVSEHAEETSEKRRESTSTPELKENVDSRNLGPEKLVESTNNSNELFAEKVSGNLELDESSSKTAEIGSNELLNGKNDSKNLVSEISSEKLAESTNTLNELFAEKVSGNLELDQSSAKITEIGLNELLNGKNDSKNLESEKLVESTNILNELFAEKVSGNLDQEKSPAKTAESSSNEFLEEKVDSKNLEAEKSSKKLVESTNDLGSNVLFNDAVFSRNLDLEKSSDKSTNNSSEVTESIELEAKSIESEKFTENLELEEFSTKTAKSSSDELLKENDSANMEFEESFANIAESNSNEVLQDKVDSNNFEPDKSPQNFTISSNDLLKEKVTENMESRDSSASTSEHSNELLQQKDSVNIVESSLNELLEQVHPKNLEIEKVSENLAESTNHSKVAEEKLFEILDLGVSVMAADSSTSSNEPLKDKFDSEYCESEVQAEITISSNELLSDNVSEVSAGSQSSLRELLEEQNSGLLKESVDNFKSDATFSLATDLPSSTDELLKDRISTFFDIDKLRDMCLESTTSSDDLLRGGDNECAKLTTSNEMSGVFGDSESSRVNLSCQNDPNNDVIASAFNSIEELRFILEES